MTSFRRERECDPAPEEFPCLEKQVLPLPRPLQEPKPTDHVVFSKKSACARSNTSAVHTRGLADQPPTSPRRQLPSWSGLKSHRPTCPDSSASCLCPILLGEEGTHFSKGAQVASVNHCPFVGSATCLQRAPRLPGPAQTHLPLPLHKP